MCTIIVNHLWKMHEVLKVHHISYCIWGNAWFVSMEKISIFDLILENRFYGFIVSFERFKDALSWLVIFRKIHTKPSWQEMSLKALRTLWIYWVFQRFLWNYLKVNYVLISCKLWALHIFTLGLWHVITQWLPYPLDTIVCVTLLSLPVFVMVMSFNFMSAMSSGFVSEY